MTVCAERGPANSIKIAAMRLASHGPLSHRHASVSGKTWSLFFLFTAGRAGAGGRFVHQVGSVVLSRFLAPHRGLEKHLIERPVIASRVMRLRKLLASRTAQRTVNQPDNFAQPGFPPVDAVTRIRLCATHTFHNAGFSIREDQHPGTFPQAFLICDSECESTP